MESPDLNREWLRWHRQHAWNPYTQMLTAPDPALIHAASGSRLLRADGVEVIDAIGSWWVNVHGHNHPAINRAINDQLTKFEHIIYAGLTHRPALQLAHELAESTAGRLPRVFYSDNGSCAVEIAMKMAFQYHWNRGNTSKCRFATLEGGYHGDTFGAMAVGAGGVFHQAFAPLLFEALRIPPPRRVSSGHGSTAEEESVAVALAAVRRLFEEHGASICAFVLEPLIQAASSSFYFYSPEYLRGLRALCDQYEVFLIADEVFTGCGRTGLMYACEHAGIWPDLLCLAKGLSGGYLPFAATLATEQIYSGFLSEDRTRTLFHGHSMTASALGCAAALASLELLRSGGIAAAAMLESVHRRCQQGLLAGAAASRIVECRALGSVGVVEVDRSSGYTADFGWRFAGEALARGVLLRPLGPAIYMAPAYNIDHSDLERCYAVTEELLARS